MARTDNLRKQHDQLIALTQEISRNLTLSEVSTKTINITMLLSKLTGLLQVHASSEDKFLYPGLLKATDTKVKTITKRFLDEMGGIDKAVSEHNTKWTIQIIKEKPNEFIKETKQLLATLGVRINKENAELYPLADTL
ncbi:hemerythrin domain-containing protein [Ignavibacteria bacterium]|nr:hemerythrin domain-containing protein [Bacteroidota bacterium]MCZ2133752.1 hemerythrin domain-containing protein [Bacteroidota bacterium]